MRVLFPGILSPIEDPLEALLVWIHQSTSLPWAWSIIVLTVIVRLVIFPITAKQTKSTLAMQRLQPYVKQLQQKHKDDRAALNVAMMEFYRDNKVNPLASCFPLLIQIPIFTALFFLLKDFQAPPGTSHDFSFLGAFIDDIRQQINNGMSAKDMLKASPDIEKNPGISGWFLLVFYVLSQMLSSWTMMNTPDPKQKIMFMALPVVFVPFILTFPVGVMLYWITTNLWSLGQYLLVVAMANRGAPPEVVLPADSKGRKKVIVPKSAKSGKSGGGGSGAKGSKGAKGGHNTKAKSGGGGGNRPQGRGSKRKR